jgi:hypothetical protein
LRAGPRFNRADALAAIKFKVHPHAVIFGALASFIVWLACACQGSPKNQLGAARRFSLFCGSTVDRHRRAKGVAG